MADQEARKVVSKYSARTELVEKRGQIIEEVRAALARVLPAITRFRRVGLIVYGPGPYETAMGFSVALP